MITYIPAGSNIRKRAIFEFTELGMWLSSEETLPDDKPSAENTNT